MAQERMASEPFVFLNQTERSNIMAKRRVKHGKKSHKGHMKVIGGFKSEEHKKGRKRGRRKRA